MASNSLTMPENKTEYQTEIKINNMEEEIWKDIPGYNGLYQASNIGRVRNMGKLYIMKHTPNKRGYLTISLHKDGHSSTLLSHRVVSLSFLPNPFNKPQVNHVNGIKTDNRVENLEWCTAQENIDHAYGTGLKDTTGENHPQCRLSDDKIAEIRKMKADDPKLSSYRIAPMFGISRAYTERILKNQSRTKLTSK